MSLDVYLINDKRGEKKKHSGSGIFVRENGQSREITREEWDEKHPGQEPVVLQDDGDEDDDYSANITHNLGGMAEKAGLYEALWRPDEIGIELASQLIEPLTAGLKKLKARRSYFEKFNPSNGWGDYEVLVNFVGEYLEACKKFPDDRIYVSR